MDLDLSEFKDSFFAECAEHIGHIEDGLLELQAGRADPERLHAIFRAAHSVKGAAGTFGWTAIVRLTHAMEDLLDRMRDARLEATPQVIRVLLSAVDEVKAIMASKDSGGDFAATLTPVARAVLSQLDQSLTAGTKQGHGCHCGPGPRGSRPGSGISDPLFPFPAVL